MNTAQHNDWRGKQCKLCQEWIDIDNPEMSTDDGDTGCSRCAEFRDQSEDVHIADEMATTIIGKCGGVYPHAVDDDGLDIVCTLVKGHDGEHQDHSREDVLCFQVSEDEAKALDWLTAVRTMGLDAANQMFPSN